MQPDDVSCSCVCLAAPDFDEPTLIGGDIAVRSEADRNADPCTSNGCLWLKYTDGKVYIPYYIANHYCKQQHIGFPTELRTQR